MKLTDYASKVKTFKESAILAQLQVTEIGLADLKDNVAKIRAVTPTIGESAERWATTRSILNTARKSGVLGHNADFLSLVTNGAVAGESIIKELTPRIRKYKQEIWDGKILTIRQANILNVIDYLAFWVNYSNTVLSVLLTQNNMGAAPDNSMTKADLRWVNGTREFYADFNVELGRGSRDIMKRLDDTPDVDADEATVDVVESTHGAGKVNLVKRGFGIHNFNPLFWIDVVKSKVNIYRIEQMRDQNMILAMKISQAANKKTGVSDANLDRQIEVYQDRIILNQNKIEDIEAQYA